MKQFLWKTVQVDVHLCTCGKNSSISNFKKSYVIAACSSGQAQAVFEGRGLLLWIFPVETFWNARYSGTASRILKCLRFCALHLEDALGSYEDKERRRQMAPEPPACSLGCGIFCLNLWAADCSRRDILTEPKHSAFKSYVRFSSWFSYQKTPNY